MAGLCAGRPRDARPGEQLIEGICDQARERGISTLYLHTHDQSTYYAKRGWTALERFEAWGKEQHLMSHAL